MWTCAVGTALAAAAGGLTRVPVPARGASYVSSLGPDMPLRAWRLMRRVPRDPADST